MLWLALLSGTHAGAVAPSKGVAKVKSGGNSVRDFRLMSGFDSLNIKFHSNWPFGPSYAVAVDPGRGLIFMGSGGGVMVFDSTLSKISEIKTRGVVRDLFYSQRGSILYIADGVGGLEIWDLTFPNSPTRLSVIHNTGEFWRVYVTNSPSPNRIAYIAAGYGGVHVYNVSNPSSPTYIGTYNIGGSGFARDVAKYGDKIFVAAGDSGVIILQDNAPNSGPTHFKSLSVGYAYALSHGDLSYRGTYAGPFNPFTDEMYVLLHDGTNYAVQAINLRKFLVERYKTLPADLQPKDIDVFAGFVWIANGNDPDTGLVRFHPNLTSYKKVKTFGPGYAVRGSGNYIYLSAGSYGVNKIKVLKDTLYELMRFPSIDICGWGPTSVIRVGDDYNLRYHLANDDGYVIVNSSGSPLSLPVCFTGTTSGPEFLAIGPHKYTIFSPGGYTGSGPDSIFVIDNTTMNVVGRAPLVGSKIQNGDVFVWEDTVYVAYIEAGFTPHLGVYRLSMSSGNLTHVRTLNFPTAATIVLKGFGDYAVLAVDSLVMVYRLRGGLTPVDTLKGNNICPGSPTEAYVFDLAYSNEQLFVLSVCSYGSADSMAVSIWDFSDPTYLKSINTQTLRATTSGWFSRMFVNRDRMYLLEEESSPDRTFINIYDVSDPFDVKPVQSTTISGDQFRNSVWVEGDTLVFTTFAGDVIFFSVNTQSPNLSNFYTAYGWTKDVEVRGNYAYLAIKDPNDVALFGGADLVILQMGLLRPYFESALQIPGTAEGLNVVNDTVYMAMGDAGVVAVDATDKSNPTVINTYNTPGYAYDVYCDCGGIFSSGLLFIADSSSLYAIDHVNFTYHEDYGVNGVAVGVQAYGNYAYVAMKGGTNGGLISIDVSGTPFTFGSHVYDVILTDAMDVSLDVLNNKAYVAYMDAGMDVVDISDPTNMSIVDWWYPPDGKVSGVYYDGVGQVMYVADYYAGVKGIMYDPFSGYYTYSKYTTPSGPNKVWYKDGLLYAASVAAGMQVYLTTTATSSNERGRTEDLLRVSVEGRRLKITASGKYTLNLYTPSGRLIKRYSGEGKGEVRLDLPTGLYFYVIEGPSSSEVGKVVVR